MSATPALESGPPLAAPKYLIVDDDEAVRRVLVRILRGMGATCLEAAGGVAALTLLAAHEVSLVLSDVKMWAMSWFPPSP